MIDLLNLSYFYVRTVHLVRSFYLNQQGTIYIYIYIYYIYIFNDTYIIITPENDTNVSKHVGVIII